MGFWLKCASVGADSLAHFERLPIPDICHERHEYIRVNFFGRCKFLQIYREKLAIYCVFCRNNAKNWQFSVYFVVINTFFSV